MPRHVRIAPRAFQAALPVVQWRRDAATPDAHGQMAPPVAAVTGGRCMTAIPGDAEARMAAMALQAFEALRAGDVPAYMRLRCPRKDMPGRSPAESRRLQMDAEEVDRTEAQAWAGEIRLQGLTASNERGGTGDWVAIRLEAARPKYPGVPRTSVFFDRHEGRLRLASFSIWAGSRGLVIPRPTALRHPRDGGRREHDHQP